MEVEFLRHKADVLERIQLGRDKSPKGCIDAPILDLVYCINRINCFVTTSSCSGRISLFAATHKHGFGAQDKGVKWLVASHSLVTTQQIEEALWEPLEQQAYSWVSLKFEPFLMHIECADFDAAKRMLTVALSCGFRESGIVIGKRVVLAIRSTALVMDCPLVCNGELVVRKEALGTLVAEANTRFMSNVHRVEQLFRAIKEEFGWAVPIGASLATDGEQLLQRWGHSIAAESNMSAWIFGGYGSADGRVQRHADVLRVTASTSSPDVSVERVPLSSDATPSARMFASTCFVDGAMLLFGGRHSPEVALNDLWRFDVSERAFHECKCDGDAISPRWGHTMSHVDEYTVLVFGGRTSDDVLADAFLLTADGSGSYRWSKLESTGPSPPARFFHAATTFSGGVIIHGGLHALQSVQPLQDMWLFRAEERVWEEVQIELAVPRFAHTISNLGGRTLAIVGGSGHSQQSRDGGLLCATLDIHQVHDADGLHWRATSRPSASVAEFAQDVPAEEVALLQHHTTWVCGSTLVTLGGGLPCLGYSPAFCRSITVRVAEGSSVAALKDSSLASTPVLAPQHQQSQSSTLLATATAAAGGVMQDVTGTESCVVVAPVQLVKKLKVLLEGAQLLDKSKRITDAQCAGTTVQLLHLESGQVEEVEDLQQWASEEAERRALYSAETKLKALPITLTAAELAAKMTAVGDGLREQLLAEGFQLVCMSTQRAPPSKVLQVSHHVHAHELLTQLRRLHGLAGDVAKDLPRKFELVGDVLMIPEDSLTGDWETIGADLWRSLAACFEVSRVARKAIVDSGPRRESKVRLLLPPVGRPATTGPGTPGWVTVKENGIRFSFDITRIMFCSGNNTERIRMSKVSAKGETVVDLYCGIGYYTLPLLVHAQAQLVHACEWNENSVLALCNNLQNNHVADRCIVHEGDNRHTAPTIGPVADRVLLGLLPSSEDGWPLAIQCLKEAGGMIHIHANILDEQLDAWLEATLETFRRLAREAGRNYLTMEYTHIERVKSYAPYVGHYVADLRCDTAEPKQPENSS